MQSRPIVHIGYHKTATTWFQDQLFPLAVSHQWVERKIVQHAFLAPPGLHFDPEQARRVLALGERRLPVLLSEENLSGYLHNGGLHGFLAPEIARRIASTLPDARIVIFIRNQFDICRASYSQYVSGGGTWNEDRYFDHAKTVHGALTRPWKAPVFEFEHFEFDRLVDHYDALFGADRVHVYLYEWMRDRDALIDRLEADLGLAFRERPGSHRRSNESLGPAATASLRTANLFTRQSVANKDVLIDLPGGQALRHAAKFILRKLPWQHGAQALDSRWQDRIATHYAESNRRLTARRALPLAKLGYPV